MLEALLQDQVPPGVQRGPGGDQPARHLHVLVLAPQQAPGGRGYCACAVRSLWLGRGRSRGGLPEHRDPLLRLLASSRLSPGESILLTCACVHYQPMLQILGSLGVSSCPSCSNSKSFKPEMIVNGIYFAETKYILPKPHVVNQEQSSNDSCGGKQIQSLDLDTR